MRQYFSTSSFIAGLMIGIALTGAYFLRSGPAPAPTSSFVATSSLPASTGSGAVAVVDQPSGDTVLIESVTVSPPGIWIAVREMRGEALGNVLGAARVEGPRTAVSVSLLRATEPDRPYAVELYRDDADGVFDPAANSVYVDFDTGAPVIVYFSTTE